MIFHSTVTQVVPLSSNRKRAESIWWVHWFGKKKTRETRPM